MKVVSVVGARPQLIKASVLFHAMRGRSGVCDVMIHTGQHYDDNMSAVFFDELDIPAPTYQLGIGSQSPGTQIGRMVEGIEQALLKENPDWVLVYGDTNSTLAGALAAAKLNIPVAHIEAGLRSYNRRMPEEINRVLTDHASECLFAPTDTAVANLRREGISADKIHRVGDVMYDATLRYAPKAEATSAILDQLGLTSGEYVLVTIHRAETTDSPTRLRALVDGLCMAVDSLPLICPLHPRTRTALKRDGLLEQVPGRIHMTEPVGYLDMMMLEKHARCIATDSGGVQKEAFFHRVPCVTLREETEWVELLNLGWNRLVPPYDACSIARAILDVVNTVALPEPSADLYGNGHAAELIFGHLVSQHGIHNPPFSGVDLSR